MLIINDKMSPFIYRVGIINYAVVDWKFCLDIASVF